MIAALFLALPAAITGGGEAEACSKVAVDIGHSRADPGALAASGAFEFAFNKRLANELVDLSRKKVSLDLFLVNPEGQSLTLAQRTEAARTNGAGVFLSIHHDSVNKKYVRSKVEGGETKLYTTAFRGFSLFVSKDNPTFARSRTLAESIGRNLKAAGLVQTLHHAEPIPGEGRDLLDWELGIYDAPFVVIKTAGMPAVLVEAGVIANPADEKLLETPEHRQKIARAVLDALEAFCGK